MNFPAGSSRSIPATATCCPNRFQSPRTRTAAAPAPCRSLGHCRPRAVDGLREHPQAARSRRCQPQGQAHADSARPPARTRRRAGRSAPRRRAASGSRRWGGRPTARRRATPNRVGGAATYAPSPSATRSSDDGRPAQLAHQVRAPSPTAPGSTKKCIRRSGVQRHGAERQLHPLHAGQREEPGRLRHVDRVERAARRQQDRGRRLLLPHPAGDGRTARRLRRPVLARRVRAGRGARGVAARAALRPRRRLPARCRGTRPSGAPRRSVRPSPAAIPRAASESERLRCLRWSLPRLTQLPRPPRVTGVARAGEEHRFRIWGAWMHVRGRAGGTGSWCG